MQLSQNMLTDDRLGMTRIRHRFSAAAQIPRHDRFSRWVKLPAYSSSCLISAIVLHCLR
jgi:hypothetical protein